MPDETILIRAVTTHPSSEDVGDGNAIWILDGSYSAHRAPFRPGDLVIDTPGWSGFREVVDVQPHRTKPRLLRLVVKRVNGLAFDMEAF